MRHCTSCGAPIEAHTYEPIPALLAKEILASAPHPAIGRSRVRGAGRRCPLVEIRPGAWRVERETDEVERKAA
jgi:hypothetical protein